MQNGTVTFQKNTPVWSNWKQTDVILEALEKFSNNVIWHRGGHKPDDRDFAVELNRWKIFQHVNHSGDLNPQMISDLYHDNLCLEYIVRALESFRLVIGDLHRKCQRRLESFTSRLSAGLHSLPDEILSQILEHATPSGLGNKQAVRLSHVSRRFRAVALRANRLWTTLSSEAHEEELKTLIARSGTECGLYVTLEAPEFSVREGDPRDVFDFRIIPFLNICLPTAFRWISLDVSSTSEGIPSQSIDEVMQRLMGFGIAALPRLRSLELLQSRSDFEVELNSWTTQRFTPTWETPNIVSIHCDEYIPRPSPSYSSVTSFTTYFTLATVECPDRFTDLREFLAADSSSHIKQLKISIHPVFDELPQMPVLDVSCPSVTSMTLEIPYLKVTTGTTALLEPLLGSLHLPTLCNLSILITFDLDDLLHADNPTELLYDFMRAILPSPELHPNVEELNLAIKYTEETRDWALEMIREMPLVIPIESIPQVSRLILATEFDVRFGREGDAHQGAHALKELKLRSPCSLHLLLSMVESLKEVNAWAAIERVTLGCCDFHKVAYARAEEEIGMEKLRIIERKADVW